MGFLEWLATGLSAGFLVRPRVGHQTPGPWQFLAVLAVFSAAQIADGRLEISGAADFNFRAWLTDWWTSAALVLAAWVLLAGGRTQPPQTGSHPIARWLTLWLPAVFPASLAGSLIAALHAHDNLPSSPWLGWGIYAGLIGWLLAVCFVTARSFLPAPRAIALAAVLLCVSLLSAWLFPHRLWYSTEPAAESAEEQPRLKLSQEVFEQQQALWTSKSRDLAPQRPGIADVYAIVFAPYAGEDVFLRESTMVAQVLGERFDAAGRTLHLVNHASTAATHLWATPENLKRAVQAVAARMDRDNDILVLYLTSHGAQDFKLAASHWPLEVAPVEPAMLRAALDEAGIRHRVIAVSACYAGGWIAPLSSDTTLVMTASDATHTSYGCGRRSPLTFFGRAMFDEQLRKTHSFEQAFAAAVPIIDQREKEGGKADGFSNPQISVGEKIRPVLRALEQRLDAPSKP
ncbi:MAG: C13 family peptidase, partial [Ramlibacter sp.]